MLIVSVKDRGLRRFIEKNDPREMRSDLINRVRNILTALIAADTMDELRGPAGWRLHMLVGDRSGTWSISASGNWRITFDIDGNKILNLDLEDYHR